MPASSEAVAPGAPQSESITADLPAAHPMSLAALHERYRAGETPARLCAEIDARISRIDDPGIFISRPSPAAREAALARLGRFDPQRYPLWGIPFVVKDNIDVAGMETSAACPGFAYLPDETAPVVARLMAAGAILIGKANLDQFATGLVGVRTPYPVPRNPFDATRVPGGSSSGSAVAVARGIASFSLGTDTAGSGRIPAAFNNLVGLKPSIGALSSRGVVPACRSLDCVSIFALGVGDARRVFDVACAYDEADPFSRRIAAEPSSPVARLGLPRAADIDFFGDDAAETAWEQALERLSGCGVTLSPGIDIAPLLESAKLLYDGPFVAERRVAVGRFFETGADAMHPTTRAIIAGAQRYSAADLFDAMHRLKAFARAADHIWSEIDALVVPTAPAFPTLAELQADPLGPNARLGTYTNFVNLLDMCAIAVPGPFRQDGLPAGVTLIAPRGRDRALAECARQFFPGYGGHEGSLAV